MTDTPDDQPEEPELDEAVSEPERRRRRLERLLPGVLKRAIERGLETGFETLTSSNETIRAVVGENVKLPKEIVGYIFSQVDETKNAMVRVVAHEIRDFLEATDLSKELQKALTSLSFEINTQIRFVPNGKGGVRPEVRAEVEPKREEIPPAAKTGRRKRTSEIPIAQTMAEALKRRMRGDEEE